MKPKTKPFQTEMDDWGFYGCPPEEEATNPYPPPENADYYMNYESTKGGSSTGFGDGKNFSSVSAAKAFAAKIAAEHKAEEGGKVLAPADDRNFSAGWVLYDSPYDSKNLWLLIGGEWVGPFPADD